MLKIKDWVSVICGGIIIIIGYTIVTVVDKIYDIIEKKEDE